MITAAVAWCCFSAAVSAPASAAHKKPNIVMIVSDDLGFNDVSFHGSPQVPTPNIDAISAEGVTLMDYHVQPVCSPTRATIMSGRHVIHTGIYMPFQQGTALRLHLNYTLLPAYLKQLGYQVIRPSYARGLTRATHAYSPPLSRVPCTTRRTWWARCAARGRTVCDAMRAGAGARLTRARIVPHTTSHAADVILRFPYPCQVAPWAKRAGGAAHRTRL